MKLYKKTLMRLFFTVEILIFVGIYIFGGNGMIALQQLQYQNDLLAKEVELVKSEVIFIEQQVEKSLINDFYKEKIAREKLQMAKKGDEIYFLE